jgi:hypothetical protein
MFENEFVQQYRFTTNAVFLRELCKIPDELDVGRKIPGTEVLYISFELSIGLFFIARWNKFPDAIQFGPIAVIPDPVHIRKQENVRLTVCCQAILKLYDAGPFVLFCWLLGLQWGVHHQEKSRNQDQKVRFH